MNYSKGIIAKIVILFVFFTSNGVSQVIIDSSFYVKPGYLNNWEFFNEDNSRIKDTSYPSSNNYLNSPYFKADSFDVKKINNVIWFRKKIRLDTSLKDQALSLSIEINGAADFYIDQKLVNSFGTVSDKEDNEELVSSRIQRIFYPFVPGKYYLIAIRYSNHHFEESFDDRGKNAFGLKIKLEESNNLFDELFSSTLSSFAFGIIISVFFFSLCFVHFVIFLYYKEEKANLYYAFFCLTAATIAGASVVRPFAYYDNIANALSISIALAPALIFTLLPYMIRSFFKLNFPKWYYSFTALFVCVILFMFFFMPFWGGAYFVLVAASVIETIRSIIIAIKRKIKGVKIISIGTSFFLIFIIVILFFIVFQINAKTSNYELGLAFLFLILLCIFSIPISITIFLSYQISLTNRSLSQKLVEVEELSIQTIEQEKEKQKILLNQKSMLEEQVLARTQEITEQKKIIEEKNKDIIDSINYAKRIQTAILPDMNFFKSVFKDSFVIYHPRDIVSGDFYYVTEINNLKILFIADCTGHGVPGALMSMVGSNLIHKIIHENKIVEPKEILQTLHVELRQALKQNQNDSQNRDGMDAAIVVLKGDELFYAGANRSLLYFNKVNELCEVKPTKTPIGGSHIMTIDIAQSVLNIKDIKEFYLFSDGFADQFGGVGSNDKYAAGKKLMISRFKNWLAETLNYTLEDKEKFLITEFKKWKGDLEQVDDVCVICVRPN